MSRKKPVRNVFQEREISEAYENFYQEESGQKIDRIEQQLLSKHLKGLEKKDFLELGCGTGHWTRFFCKIGFPVTAIDSSENMLEIAKKNKPANCEFLKADATQLPFSDNSFSTVASVTMLEFVEDVNKVMDEIDRILKPGGTLVLGCLNENSELGKTKESDPVFQHARFFTPQQIEAILSRFGNPHINYGVYFSSEFEILDGTEKQIQAEPAFFVASVKKKIK